MRIFMEFLIIVVVMVSACSIIIYGIVKKLSMSSESRDIIWTIFDVEKDTRKKQKTAIKKCTVN
jgi:hypothetical protein